MADGAGTDGLGAQDGVPLWGSPPPPGAVPSVEALPDPPRAPGSPPWGTAQRPRGAARRSPDPGPEGSGWGSLKGPGLLLLVGLAAGALVLLGIGPPEDRADRVQADGTVATATVVQVLWMGNRDVALRYEHAGRTYTVHRGSTSETPDQLAAGDTLNVWVDPQDPSWAYARELDPVPAWRSDLVGLAFLVAMPSLIIGAPMFVGVLVGQLAGLVARTTRRRRRGGERLRG